MVGCAWNQLTTSATFSINMQFAIAGEGVRADFGASAAFAGILYVDPREGVAPIELLVAKVQSYSDVAAA